MNLDQLINQIRKVSKDETVQKLAINLQEWKTDEKNAIELRDSIERFLGNSWINERADFDKVYRMWAKFKESVIERIGGMTMNERLYLFGLMDSFENSKSEAEKEKYYRKLMARK